MIFNALEFLSQPRHQQSRPGLERIRPLMNALGNPQNQLKFVHVAGTNGKGSTCAYLAQIFQEAGYKTGLFISPFIFEFNERIQINRQNISNSDLNAVTLQVKKTADSLFKTPEYPTEFELYTAIAYTYFAQQHCDIVVAEVGMGGRLDSTNIIADSHKVLAVICPISIDHTNFLGNNLSDIAAEKAGIILQGNKVISAAQPPDALKIIQNRCTQMHADLQLISPDKVQNSSVEKSGRFTRHFTYEGKAFYSQLIANYQPQNAALAIESARVLQSDFPKITEKVIANGIAKTKWPVRFEVIRQNPTCIVDGSHNVQGAQSFVQTFREVFPGQKALLIVGVLADKQYQQMASELAKIAKSVICITPPNARTLQAVDLAKEFSKYVDQVYAAKTLEEAAAHAFAEANATTLISANREETTPICAVGSLYSAAQLYRLLKCPKTPENMCQKSPLNMCQKSG